MPSSPVENDDATARLISAHPVFAQLPAATVAGLVERCPLVGFAAGEVLLQQGEPSDFALLLLAGEIEVLVETAYGQVRLAQLGGPCLIGEIGVFTGRQRTATVRAVGSAEGLRIAKAEMLRIGEESPGFLLSVLQQLGSHIDRFNRAIGFYTQALGALERQDFDMRILDDLRNPVPELVNFAQTFRRMAEQIVERRTQQAEMASASAIQRAMLPRPLSPEVVAGRFRIEAAMRPARDVGGDFYDFFPLDGDRLALIIGDVSGKGVPASLFMAMTQTVMRVAVRQNGDLADAVRQANAVLSADNEEMMFATLFCGVIDLASGVLAYCNCGHNPPFVLGAAQGIVPLPATGPLLAVAPDAIYVTGRLQLAVGDRLFLYTDGVTEAINATEEQFGEERLVTALQSLRQAAAAEMVAGVVRCVDAFSEGMPQFDDITCLALFYGPADD